MMRVPFRVCSNLIERRKTSSRVLTRIPRLQDSKPTAPTQHTMSQFHGSYLYVLVKREFVRIGEGVFKVGFSDGLTQSVLP
jgi:hypothetical protein